MVKSFGDWGQGVRIKASLQVRQTLGIGCGLLAMAFITGSLGNLSRTLNGALAIGSLMALALLIPWRPRDIPPWRLALALAVMAISLPIAARGGTIGLMAAALFVFALSLVTSDKDARTPTSLLLTALLFGSTGIAIEYVSLAWHGQQALAIGFSWLAGSGLRLGPTALGLPLVALFACYALSVFLLSLHREPRSGTRAVISRQGRFWRSLGDLFAWLLALILAAVAYLWLQPRLGTLVHSLWPAPSTASPVPGGAPDLTYLEWLPLLFLLLWLVSALASSSMRPIPLPLRPRPGSARWAAIGLVLLGLAAIVLTLEPPYQPRRGTVLFYDAGQLEWGRPVFGQYGPHSGGTFGLWPDYLAAYGYTAQNGLLTAQNLADARVVVLINLPQNLTADEKKRLLAFVESGGALIIWGEHTGVGRIREPINDLLAGLPGAPIHLRFDSAVPVRQGWAEGLVLRPHPATQGIQDPIDLVIAVGASLRIGPPAVPLIVGRFGHSDMGDAGNRARNYVGDMRYNPGEQLGDVVLAAQVPYGSGQIVVLGDTTPLGSVNLMTNMPFHARLLDWITAERSKAWDLVLRNGWLAVLLFAGAAACLAAGRCRLALVAAALVLGLTLTLTGKINADTSAPAIPQGAIAYVDVSHQERFDRLLWETTSIGGLDYNLVRNGALPLLLHEIDAGALERAELLVIIAPGGRFSAREVETINGWVSQGGRLLVSAGFEESEASKALLASFGLSVGHIPLGPVALEREAGPVRFHEAWPVSAVGEAAQPIVEGYGYPLATHQPWGKGGVVLIGDSAFLLGGNLEDQYSYQEGNILLLRDILTDYLAVGGAP